MFEFSKNKLSIPVIWKESFKFYKLIFSKVWYLFLVMAVITSLPSLIISTKSKSYIFVAVIVLLISLFFMAMILHRMVNSVIHQHSSLSNSIKFTASKYLILVISMLIFYLSVIVGFGLPVIIALLLRIGRAGVLMGGLIVTFLGVSFIFNVPLILMNDKGALSALSTSYKLVWNDWWRTFAVFVLPSLLMVLPQIFIISTGKTQSIWISIISVVISIIVVPYFYSVLLVHFNDLKLRKPELGLR